MRWRLRFHLCHGGVVHPRSCEELSRSFCSRCAAYRAVSGQQGPPLPPARCPVDALSTFRVPRFEFLQPWHQYNAYYEFKKQFFVQKEGGDSAQVPVHRGAALRGVVPSPLWARSGPPALGVTGCWFYACFQVRRTLACAAFNFSLLSESKLFLNLLRTVTRFHSSLTIICPCSKKNSSLQAPTFGLAVLAAFAGSRTPRCCVNTHQCLRGARTAAVHGGHLCPPALPAGRSLCSSCGRPTHTWSTGL